LLWQSKLSLNSTILHMQVAQTQKALTLQGLSQVAQTQKALTLQGLSFCKCMSLIASSYHLNQQPHNSLEFKSIMQVHILTVKQCLAFHHANITIFSKKQNIFFLKTKKYFSPTLFFG